MRTLVKPSVIKYFLMNNLNDSFDQKTEERQQ